MNKRALLVDIGSTYTKTILFDLDRIELIGHSQSYTTVESDITIGLQKALSRFEGWEKAEYKLACSSAAGGLKMVAIGLVPSLTAEAARRAALGAGSKIMKTFSYQLTEDDIKEIKSIDTDIILLAGGTDGGNKDNIIYNSGKLADSELDIPIVLAGNRNAADQVKDILNKADKEIYVTENVMPELEELNIEPARELIREIFLKKIIQAKGLEGVNNIIDGIIMPTPSAVMTAAQLMADGTSQEEGLGELVIVDVGGATTDVHSVTKGEPQKSNVTWRGLQEPYVKRTVEGDLGMRYSAPSLYQAIGGNKFKQQLKKMIQANEISNIFNDNSCDEVINKFRENIGIITTGQERIIDKLLARNAVRLAMARHAGILKTVFTPLGQTYIQEGKDLTGVKYLIGTGGIIVNSNNPQDILTGAFYKNQAPELLAPIEPECLVDSKYLLAACGLLAGVEPEKSLLLMKKYIISCGS